MRREELEEVMKLVKPQHFLPVHGEYAFLCAHAQLARDIGVNDTSVIRNGAFLGVAPKRNSKTVSSGSMQVLGEAALRLFYNDGNKVGMHGSAMSVSLASRGASLRSPKILCGAVAEGDHGLCKLACLHALTGMQA